MRLGGNARSTVGTISDMYSLLRLLFSRIGSPAIGPASYFSFNNPNGMCPTCAGIGKIMDLDMSVDEALPFFAGNKKITGMLGALMEVGLPYISLGQPLSTFSGGERQRVKLAQNIKKKGNIYILDEPTTGLHAADIAKVVDILESFVDRGNTVIVIEHNTDVMKLADYIIDVGPDGGTKGGEIVFTGTPREMFENGTTITAKYLRK